MSASQLKSQGNSLFSAGQYPQAVECYSKAMVCGGLMIFVTDWLWLHDVFLQLARVACVFILVVIKRIFFYW